MSADMMITCKDDNSHYEGSNTDEAFFVDKTSMGEAWHEFGKAIGGFVGGYSPLTNEDASSVARLLDNMECHEGMDKGKLESYLQSHIGKKLDIECW